MTERGEALIESLEQVLAFVRDGDTSKVRITIPPEIDAKKMREKAGLTQEEFAERFGFDLWLLKEWEIGRRVPVGKNRETLENLYKNPELAQETPPSSAE